MSGGSLEKSAPAGTFWPIKYSVEQHFIIKNVSRWPHELVFKLKLSTPLEAGTFGTFRWLPSVRNCCNTPQHPTTGTAPLYCDSSPPWKRGAMDSAKETKPKIVIDSQEDPNNLSSVCSDIWNRIVAHLKLDSNLQVLIN